MNLPGKIILSMMAILWIGMTFGIMFNKTFVLKACALGVISCIAFFILLMLWYGVVA